GLVRGQGVVAGRAALADEWRRRWGTILVASAMNLTSYLLVLFAFRLSKVGYVVASRELSILFSAFIGSLWLGEGRLAPRLAGASIVLARVICVAFAREEPPRRTPAVLEAKAKSKHQSPRRARFANLAEALGLVERARVVGGTHAQAEGRKAVRLRNLNECPTKSTPDSSRTVTQSYRDTQLG